MDDCPEDPMQALVWEYDQRMDQDYYGFLGLPRDATLKDLAEDGRKLAQRLTTLSRIDDLPQPVQKRVQEMLTAVHLVFATLTDTRRKEEYDALLDDGQAPQITSQPQEPLAAADAHITRAHQSFRGPPAEPARGWRFWRKDGQE